MEAVLSENMVTADGFVELVLTVLPRSDIDKNPTFFNIIDHYPVIFIFTWLVSVQTRVQ